MAGGRRGLTSRWTTPPDDERSGISSATVPAPAHPPADRQRGNQVPRSERLRWPSRSTVGLVVGPLLAAVVAWAVPDMTPAATDAPRYAGALTAATLVLMGVWWMTEALPLAVTALLPLVVLPVAGVAPMSDVAEPYANKVIFLFLGGFVLAIALQRWDVHLRIALGVVRLVGTAPRRLVLGMMTATALVSMWVSNTATAVMMLPISTSPPPLGYLVSACADTSTPRLPPSASRSNGWKARPAPQVLSSTVVTPRARQA